MSETETPRTRKFVAPVAVLVAVSLILGGVIGFLVGRGTAPGDESADAGFARDMTEHHAQAVDMALIIREKTDDPVLRALAYDIATTQENQMGQMQAWLVMWGLPQARKGEPMAWMMASHEHMGHTSASMMQPNGLMPGMASPEDMERLRTATGVEAEKLFFDLMIVHHVAGVDMAKAGADLAKEPYVKDLAQKMVDGQESEITLMKDLKAKRG